MPLKPRSGLEPGDAAHPIEVLGLSSRPYNALRRSGVRSVERLLQTSEVEILNLRGIGGICYDEIRRALRPWQQAPPTQTGPPTVEADVEDSREEQALLATWPLPASLSSDQTHIAAPGLKLHSERELVARRVCTVGQLEALPESRLSGLRWFGFRTVEDIRQRLSDYARLQTSPRLPNAPPGAHLSRGCLQRNWLAAGWNAFAAGVGPSTVAASQACRRTSPDRASKPRVTR